MSESFDGLLDVGWAPRGLPPRPLAWVKTVEPHIQRNDVKGKKRMDLHTPQNKPPKLPRALRGKNSPSTRAHAAAAAAAASSNDSGNTSAGDGTSGDNYDRITPLHGMPYARSAHTQHADHAGCVSGSGARHRQAGRERGAPTPTCDSSSPGSSHTPSRLASGVVGGSVGGTGATAGGPTPSASSRAGTDGTDGSGLSAVAQLMLREERDPRIHWLPHEVESGNIEYKFRLCSPNAMRTQQLITQLRFRLSQGAGVCFYYLGVLDDGYPKGLSLADLEASMSTLQSMASSLDAHATLVRHLAGAHGRLSALVRISRGMAEEATWTDLRIAVLGCVDAGKSTLVAVLTHGAEGAPMLETGKGTARMSVFQHKHEIESGRTSSLSQQLLGYDRNGRVLNYAGQQESCGADVCLGASKVLTLIDMGGHERFLKTAMYGMTAFLPDFALLCCCAMRGLARVSREHLAAALALEIPVAVVITKADSVDATQLEHTVQDIRSLLSTAVPYLQPAAHADASKGGMGDGAAAGGAELDMSVLAPVVGSAEEARRVASTLVGQVPRSRGADPLCPQSPQHHHQHHQHHHQHHPHHEHQQQQQQQQHHHHHHQHAEPQPQAPPQACVKAAHPSCSHSEFHSQIAGEQQCSQHTSQQQHQQSSQHPDQQHQQQHSQQHSQHTSQQHQHPPHWPTMAEHHLLSEHPPHTTTPGPPSSSARTASIAHTVMTSASLSPSSSPPSSSRSTAPSTRTSSRSHSRRNSGDGGAAASVTPGATAASANGTLVPPPTSTPAPAAPASAPEGVHAPMHSPAAPPHVIPIFVVSAVTGVGLPVLHAFLQSLQPASVSARAAAGATAAAAAAADGDHHHQEAAADDGCAPVREQPGQGGIAANGSVVGTHGHEGVRAPVGADAAAGSSFGGESKSGSLRAHSSSSSRCHFQVCHTFAVEGVGSVVSGTVLQGTIAVGQQLLLGPDAQADFVDVEVTGIKRGHIPVRLARAGQTATLALQPATTTSSSDASTGSMMGPASGGSSQPLPLPPISGPSISYPHGNHQQQQQQQQHSGPTEGTSAPPSQQQQQQQPASCHDTVSSTLTGAGSHTVVSITAHAGGSSSSSGGDGVAGDCGRVLEGSHRSENRKESDGGDGKKAGSGGVAGGVGDGVQGDEGVRSVEGGLGGEGALREGGSGEGVVSNGGGGGGDGGEKGVDLDNLAPDLLELFDMEDEEGEGEGEGEGLFTGEQHRAGTGVCAPVAAKAKGEREAQGSGRAGEGSSGNGENGGSGARGEQSQSRGVHQDEGVEKDREQDAGFEAWRRRQGLEWEQCRLATSPTAPTFLARSPPSSRKGAVLLDASSAPRTFWCFEAVLVLFGGQWPARGLLSGRWPPVCHEGEPHPQECEPCSQGHEPHPRVHGGPDAQAAPLPDTAATPNKNKDNRLTVSSSAPLPQVTASSVPADSLTSLTAYGTSSTRSGSTSISSSRGRQSTAPTAAAAAAGVHSPPSPPAAHARSRSTGRPKARKRTAGQYSVMVHCASIRQLARLVSLQEEAALPAPAAATAAIPTSAHTAGLTLPAGMRAAAALVATCGNRCVCSSSNGDSGADGGTEEEGTQSAAVGATGEACKPTSRSRAACPDVGCIATATFRFVHRSEWLCEGAPLIVRDRNDGRLSGAGFIRALRRG